MQGTQIPGDTGTSRRQGDNVSNKQLESRIAKMVREDSKTLVRPTSTASLMALAPGLSADITDDAVIDLVSKEKYWDIKRVRAVTRHNYLFSNMYLTQEQAERSALIGEFKTDLVDRVRESSREERPVRLSSVASVGPALRTHEIEAGLAEIAADAECSDIKQVVVFSGAAFLYSDLFMAKDRAEARARGDELERKALTLVREDSQYSAKVTRFEKLATIAPDPKEGEIEHVLDTIMKNNPDVIRLPGLTGPGYFFSNRHMTENYAKILARVEEADPCYTIAEMVREESRIYPRPTNIELFKYGMFNIDRERLDEFVKKVLDENEDINGYRSANGNVYLYSTQYLPDAQAALIVERKEHPE